MNASQSLPRFQVFTSQQGLRRRRSQEGREGDGESGLRTSTAGGPTTLIALSTLHEIRERMERSRDPEAERRHKDKVLLHELSAQRIDKWPNTIFTVKKTKESVRFEKFRAEEEERRRIDEEEARYQQAVRTQHLERANKQIYENQDRVRTFQSKLLMSDVLQEREEQLEVKKVLAQIDRRREEMHAEEARELAREEDEAAARKQEVLLEKKRAAQKVLAQQREEMKRNYVKKLQAEKIEGEIMKIKAEQAVEEQRRADLEKREKNVRLQAEIREGNEVLQRFKDDLRERERVEDLKIEEHFQKKEQIAKMRKMREDQKFRERQEQRQRLIDAQIKKLEELRSQEDKRLENQIREAEIKAEDAERRKQQYCAALKARIDTSTRQTLERKAQQRVRDKEEDKHFQAYWREKNAVIQAEEVAAHREAREREMALQQYRQSQIEQKERARERAVVHELEEAERIRQLREREDQQFSTWAERALVEWKSDGKNLYPMLKNLREQHQQSAFVDPSKVI